MRRVTQDTHATARARALVGRAWRELVRRPLQRMLHPARRREALRRIAALRHSLGSVLVVCQGNICRSPYAAGALSRSLVRQGVRGVVVRSVGFLESGRPAPPAAVAAAARGGVDLGRHRSQCIHPRAVERADLVIVMDERQERALRLLFGKPRQAIVILADLLPAFGEARVIPDPVDQPLETFERVYFQIDACVATISTLLATPRG